jgi:hypothetical protein
VWCVLACGSGGGNFECRAPQPLLAAVTAPGVNPGFVREDSVWALLIAVKMEDFSTADPRLWSTEMLPESRCFEACRSGDLLIPGDEFVAQLQAAAAGRPVVVGLVAAAGDVVLLPPDGFQCLGGFTGPTCTQAGTSIHAAPRLYPLAAATEALHDPNLRAVTIDSCNPPSGDPYGPTLVLRPFFTATPGAPSSTSPSTRSSRPSSSAWSWRASPAP